MDWKTPTSRYPEIPAGLLSLDPQLICCSWAAGISHTEKDCHLDRWELMVLAIPVIKTIRRYAAGLEVMHLSYIRAL
jgi:hypothetical protein